MVADVMPISIAAGFIVAAGIASDIVAVWQWRQGSKETSVARLVRWPAEKRNV
jgi:hypothetical protein